MLKWVQTHEPTRLTITSNYIRLKKKDKSKMEFDSFNPWDKQIRDGLDVGCTNKNLLSFFHYNYLALFNYVDWHFGLF